MAPKTEKWFRAVCVFVLCSLLAGCALPDPFPLWRQPGLDIRQQPDGRVSILDTQRTWNAMSAVFAAEVKQEAKGAGPPGGTTSWQEFWHLTFSEIRTEQQHPERYFAMVVGLRRQSELPDLRTETIGE